MDNKPPEPPISAEDLGSLVRPNSSSEKPLPTVTSYECLSSDEYPQADLCRICWQAAGVWLQEFLGKVAGEPVNRLQQYQLGFGAKFELTAKGRKSPLVSLKKHILLIIIEVEKDESNVVDSSPPKADIRKGEMRKGKSKSRKKDIPSS